MRHDIEPDAPSVDDRELNQLQDATAYPEVHYESEHLETVGNDTFQGLMDSITEGTISVPHTHDQIVRDAVSEQYERNKEIDELNRSVQPGNLDVIQARRMRVRRFTLLPTSGAIDGTSVRVLQVNYERRYFIIYPDTSASLVWFSTVASNLANDANTFPFANTSPVQQFWHQGELWAKADHSQVNGSSFTIVEFLAQ